MTVLCLQTQTVRLHINTCRWRQVPTKKFSNNTLLRFRKKLSHLPRSVVTQASMDNRVTKLNMSDVEGDGTGRQTMCFSHLSSFGLPLSSVCIPPRRQGQMVTVTVPVLVSPEAPSRSTTGTYRVSKDEEKPGRGSKAVWSTRLAVTPDNNTKKDTHQM